jgi:hypothetical protein
MLENFRYFQKNNIFVINKVSILEIFDGFKVLFIPEEYPADQEAYYADFFNQSYDFILGHGQVDKLSHLSQIQESERSIPTAPVFKLSELSKLAYLIIFGHVHTYQQIKNFFYCGSFTRSSHNEEKDKGFLRFDFNTKTKKYNLTFIENQFAQQYITVRFTNLDGVTFEDKILFFKRLIKENPEVKYRLEISVNDELSDVESKLLEKLTRNENISVKQKKVLKQTQEEEEYLERFSFVNQELPIDQIIQKFIAENNGVELDISDIDAVLYD